MNSIHYYTYNNWKRTAATVCAHEDGLGLTESADVYWNGVHILAIAHGHIFPCPLCDSRVASESVKVYDLLVSPTKELASAIDTIQCRLRDMMEERND